MFSWLCGYDPIFIPVDGSNVLSLFASHHKTEEPLEKIKTRKYFNTNLYWYGQVSWLVLRSQCYSTSHMFVVILVTRYRVNSSPRETSLRPGSCNPTLSGRWIIFIHLWTRLVKLDWTVPVLWMWNMSSREILDHNAPWITQTDSVD